MELTPEKWALARAVLLGESSKVVSLTAAAKAAGITRAELNSWIKRSGQKRIEDEPWVHEIAEVLVAADGHKADKLTDKAWERSLDDKKTDNKLLVRMIEKYDPDFAPKKDAPAPFDIDEIYRRMMAIGKIKDAEKGALIEGVAEEVNDDEFRLPDGI